MHDACALQWLAAPEIPGGSGYSFRCPVERFLSSAVQSFHADHGK